MSRHDALVRSLARRVPAPLRALRAKLMIESLCETLGVEEVACPACGGSGWLERSVLRSCPLCLGCREGPDRLAEWFTSRVSASGRDGPSRRREPRHPDVVPADSVPRAPSPAGQSERYGRLAETLHRAHLPAFE